MRWNSRGGGDGTGAGKRPRGSRRRSTGYAPRSKPGSRKPIKKVRVSHLKLVEMAEIDRIPTKYADEFLKSSFIKIRQLMAQR